MSWPDQDRLYDCGEGVWVGGFHNCVARRAEFALVIHAFSAANLRDGRMCDRAGGLAVETTEGDPLTAAQLRAVGSYCRRPGRLLLHCAGGACRSPTLAVVAKIARGRDPFDAVRDIFRAAWRDARMTPTINYDPMRTILEWWEAGSPGESP